MKKIITDYCFIKKLPILLSVLTILLVSVLNSNGFSANVENLSFITERATFYTPIEYFVDPVNGSTSSGTTGTLADPFKTIEQARDAVRLVNSNMTSDIYVYLRGGEYQLSSTLTFGANDRGTNGFKIIYKAYNSEKPLISGGKQVSGWTPVSGTNYFVADVPTAAGFPTYFRNIWVDDKRAFQTKGPYITAHPMLYDNPSTTQVRDGYIVKASELKNYTNISDIRIFQEAKYKHVELPFNSIVSVTSTEKAIVMNQPDFLSWTNNQLVFRSPNLIRVINAFEELDEPGEFYLNRVTQKLYYYPRVGENMSTSKVVVPSIETLLKVIGSSGNVITNVQFEGLSFEFGNWTTPLTKEIGRSQADLYADYTAFEGQIQLQFTDNITFKRCRFEHLTSSCIYLPDNNNNTLIEGNVFNDLTAAAILIGKDQTPRATVNVNTTIRNNVIRSVGADFYQSSGIYANTSKNLTITHNDVADIAYFGINQRYSDVSTNFVGNTQITYNKVVNYCIADKYGFGIGDEVAGIYYFGVQDSKVSRNYVQYGGNKEIAGAFRQDQYGLNNTWEYNVADCKTCDRSFSWYNLQTGNVLFSNNYANKAGEFRPLTTATNVNLDVQLSAPAWSAAAQAIIDETGLEAAYSDLLNGFIPSTYDNSPVPELQNIAWSQELWDFLVSKRVPFAQSTSYWKIFPSGNRTVSITSGIVKINTEPTSSATAIFRGAYYGNEAIKFFCRIVEPTTTRRQIICFRGPGSTSGLGEPGYQLVLSANRIVLNRVNKDGTNITLLGTGGTFGGAISYTSALYSTGEVMEIGTFNQADGVRLILKIGNNTIFDIVDTVSGYFSNEGFIRFNNGGAAASEIYVSNYVAVNNITLPSSESVTVGFTKQLTATFVPTNASDKRIIWSSSNPSVATVSSTGLITGVAMGSTTISATTVDGNKVASVNVAVTEFVPLSGIAINGTATVGVSASRQLTASVVPSNATFSTITWSSSNTSIATVNSTGIVTGVAAGSVNITATSQDGSKVGTCVVTVVNGNSQTSSQVWQRFPIPTQTGVFQADYDVLANSLVSDAIIGFQNGTTSSPQQQACIVRFTFGKIDARNGSTYPTSSFNYTVGTVYHVRLLVNVSTKKYSIYVTAPGQGEVVLGTDFSFRTEQANVTQLTSWAIWASSGTHTVRNMTITVPVTGISVSSSALNLGIGATQPLTATIAPSNATNLGVNWVSSNPSIASVSTSGLVTASTCGTAQIYAISQEGNRVATSAVTVSQPVTGVSLNTPTVSLNINGTSQLSSTVAPANACNQGVTWSSTNPSVASVDSTGLVTGLSCGTATITATSVEGGFTSTSTVTVTQPVTGISLNHSSSIFTSVGKTLALSATISPVNACNQGVTWSSSNPSVASVDGNGLVTSLSEGTTVITATSESFTASYTAIVAIPLVRSASRCGSGELSLSCEIDTGFTVKWYSSPTGGTSLFSGTNYRPVLSTSTSYYVSLSQGAIESTERLMVIGTINPIPSVSFNTESRLGAGVVTLSANVIDGNRIAWYESASSVAPFAIGSIIQTDTLRQTRYYYVQGIDSLTTCTSAKSGLKVSVSYDLMGGQFPGNIYRNRPSELGMLFRPLVNGKVTKIRYLRIEGDNGYHSGKLWDAASKSLLAQSSDIPKKSGPASVANGWIKFSTPGDSVWGIWEEVVLSSPLPVVAGKEYLVSVNAQTWPFSVWGLAFTLGNKYIQTVGERSQNASNNGLNAYYGSGFVYTGSTVPVYPDQSHAYSNYFRDIEFETDTLVSPSSYSLLTSELPKSSTGDGIYELGMRFKATTSGKITKLRYFRMKSDLSYHTGKIWDASSKSLLLETGEIPNTMSESTSANGWKNLTSKYETGNWGIWEEITLASPLMINAGQEYVVSVNAGKPYPFTNNGLLSSITTGSLSSVGGGVFYKYGNTFTYNEQTIGKYPESSYLSSNYFRDVVFEPLSDVVSTSTSRLQASDALVGLKREGYSDVEPLHLSVLPNPIINNELVVNFSVSESLPCEQVRLNLYDMQGREVIRLYEGGNERSKQVVSPVTSLGNGSYLLRLEVDTHQLTKKVMISR